MWVSPHRVCKIFLHRPDGGHHTCLPALLPELTVRSHNLMYVFSYVRLALASDVSIVSDMQHGTPSTGLQQKFTLTLNSQNVQAVMNRQGLSVTELARRANVSRGELAKSIKGEYLASWKTIGRVAEALEVHPAAISTWNVAP